VTIVRKNVGSGITRHEQIILQGTDTDERAAYEREIKKLGGYINPQNFPAWLDRYEAELAHRATLMRLPTKACAMVIFDAEDRGRWHYDHDGAAVRIVEDSEFRSTHQFKTARAQLAMFYLAEERIGVRGWGCQSVRWYMGTLMRLAHMCRQALESGAWLELAGWCIELGALDREFRLKFSAQRRLKSFEQRTCQGALRGNARKRVEAEQRQLIVKQILASYPNIDSDNASAAARAVLTVWPQGHKMPAARTLRDDIGKLAKRGVPPES